MQQLVAVRRSSALHFPYTPDLEPPKPSRVQAVVPSFRCMKRLLDQTETNNASEDSDRQHRPPPFGSPRPEEHGLSPEQSHCLARRLQCDSRDVVAETLGYILNSRATRGCHLSRGDIVELWDSLQEAHKTKDSNTPSAQFIVLGVNPRFPKHVTIATNHLAQVTRALCTFVKQQQPSFSFTTLSLRLNCDKPPHRDIRNGPGLSFIQSLEPVEGGGIWIADSAGTVEREVHGQVVKGTNVECFRAPLLLDARRRLHATEPWVGARRLLLTAWSVLNVPRNRDLVTQLTEEYGFPVSHQPPDEPTNQQSLRTAFQRSVQNTTRGGLMLQGSCIVQEVDSQDNGSPSDDAVPQDPPESCSGTSQDL